MNRNGRNHFCPPGYSISFFLDFLANHACISKKNVNTLYNDDKKNYLQKKLLANRFQRVSNISTNESLHIIVHDTNMKISKLSINTNKKLNGITFTLYRQKFRLLTHP